MGERRRCLSGWQLQAASAADEMSYTTRSQFSTCCRNWSISAVPVSAHPFPLVITTKLAAAILVVAVVQTRGSAGPVLPL